jgi:hypothetical protein
VITDDEVLRLFERADPALYPFVTVFGGRDSAMQGGVPLTSEGR